MKLFTIMLALTIFTGSWDSVLSDEPVSKLDQLVGNIEEYFKDISGGLDELVFFVGDEPFSKLKQLTRNIQDNVSNISRGIEELAGVVRESDLAHEIKDYLDESYSNISLHLHKVEAYLPEEVIRTVRLVFGFPARVAIEVLFGYPVIINRLKTAIKEVYEMLEPVTSPYAKPAVDQVRKYTDVLRTRIKELNKNQKLKLQLEELETKVGPYVKNVQNRLREFQVALQPWADKAQERFTENIERATNSLKPYVGPVLWKLEDYDSHVRNWVMSFISPIFA